MRHRTLIFAAFLITLVTVIVAMLLIKNAAPVITAAPSGRHVFDDGSLGYGFIVTNHTTQSLRVTVSRNNATNDPNAWIAYAYNVTTTLKPMATCYVSLSPPNAGVPWSVDVRYLRTPGRFESTMRTFGARFRLCKSGSQAQLAQRLEIKK